MTTSPSVEEIQTSIDALPRGDVPTLENIKGPNYKLFAMAPYWRVHQAVCLLTGIKIIDDATFHALVHLSKIQLTLNIFFQKEEKLDCSKKLADRERFSDYIVRAFPIPHDSIVFIQNVYQQLSLALKNGELSFTEQRMEGILTKLLLPEEVITWAKKVGIDVPSTLVKGLKLRTSGKLLHLPKTFPDEVHFYSRFIPLKIEQNRRCPLSPSSLSSTPVPVIADERPPDDDKMSHWHNLSTEELKKDTLSLIHCVVSPRGNELSNAGIKQLRDKLQKRASCPKTLFQKTTWSFEEAFLAYHNISPDVFISPQLTNNYSLDLCRQLIHLLDRDEKIYENLSNYMEHQHHGKIRWTLTQEQFTIFLKEKGYAVPSHFQSFQDKSVAVQDIKIEPLTGRAKELFDEARKARCNALNLALEILFSDKNIRSKHLDLIGTLGIPSEEEFRGKKGPTPQLFLVSHRCRAVGKLLRHFDSSISIDKIYNDVAMKTVYAYSRFKLKSFKGWMRLEGIYDRKPRK